MACKHNWVETELKKAYLFVPDNRTVKYRCTRCHETRAVLIKLMEHT